MATLIGTVGRDRLTGTAGDDMLSGLEEKDTLLGLDGNDLLDGGLGADTATGGLGNDVYRIDNRNDRAVEVAGEGTDRIESTVAFTLPANVENLTLLGIARLNGVGNDLDNTIIGNADRNALSGLAGNDRLEGGDGADRLDGGAGADTLIGGAGNDGYTVDNAGDSIVELAGGGFEQVTTAMSFTLPDNVERLTLLGTGNLDGAGNAVNNLIRGTSGANLLMGLAGRDRLEGMAGNDRLDGGTGADTLTGGLGDDVYVVDHGNDRVVEAANAGTDRVEASANHTLAANVENLTLTGTVNLAGTGNTLANVIAGNAGRNTLSGGGGADTLLGNGGDDVLAVADTAFAMANGGIGGDTLRLGASGSIDLTALLAKLTSIETIDLAGAAGGTTLGLGAAEVIALSEATNTLIVRGDAMDTVAFDAGDAFAAAGTQAVGGVTFNRFVSGLATVLVQQGVAAIDNSPPSAFADGASTTENAAVAIAVLANDSDLDGDPLIASLAGPRSAGGAALSLMGDQAIYNPGTAFDFLVAGATATDTFTYMTSDGRGGSASATATVTITGANDAPIAMADSASTTENAAVTIAVLANDGDPDIGDVLTVVATISAGLGAVTTNADNTISFNPGTAFDFLAAGETASETFTYTVSDGQGGLASASVTVTVIGEIDAPPPTALPTLIGLNGANGFRLDGGAAGDFSGAAVSTAGDVNGDGFADLVVGAPFGDPHGESSGSSYVIFGGASGFAATRSLSTLNGINGFRLDGVAAYDFSGAAVSTAGDINGDGIADIVVGAPVAVGNGFSGASYVIFGRLSGFAANIELSSLDGTAGFRIDGGATGDASGISLSDAGDVNGDGLADIIVGAPLADPNGSYSGSTYVVFGRTAGFGSALALSSLDGANGFRLDGGAGFDQSGSAISAAGDVNGDGFGDVIVGAYSASPNGIAYAGSSYVVFGRANGFASALALTALDGTTGFRLDGGAVADLSGYAVSSAGDVNGDGFADLIVGAYQANVPLLSTAGASYVVFGRASGFASVLSLTSLDGSNGFRLEGAFAGDNSGIAVSAAGDVNGDGIDDIIVGASGADPNGASSAGSSHVVFGRTDGFRSILSLSPIAVNFAGGFRLDGVAGFDYSGAAVSGAGDVDGDGFADLIVGAYGADPNGQSGAGSTHVVFGGNFSGAVDLLGGDGNDTLAAFKGAGASDVLIGGRGQDTLAGDGGADVLIGGQGDDTLAIADLAFRRVDGGTGFDTLRLDAGGSIDLSAVRGHVRAVEELDIDNNAANTLDVRLADVLALDARNIDALGTTRDNVLAIDVGEGEGDRVNLAATDNWTEQAGVAFGGETFRIFTSNAVTLAIDNDAQVAFV